GVLPGTSTPRAMQGDGTNSGMIVTGQRCSRTCPPRGLLARWGGMRAVAAIALVCAALGGCTGEQFQKGYILPPGALEQIPIGASQDQVLIVMGTPSTVATLNGEVLYYISQRSSRCSAESAPTCKHGDSWTPDQQRTTPQARRVAQHPGNVVSHSACAKPSLADPPRIPYALRKTTNDRSRE